MIRNLMIKMMAILFLTGFSVTPVMADSDKHDRDHRYSKHDGHDKDKKKYTREDERKVEAREKKHEDHNKNPDRY